MSVFTIGFTYTGLSRTKVESDVLSVVWNLEFLKISKFPIRLWAKGYYHFAISLLIYTDDIERKFYSNFCVWFIRSTTSLVDTLTLFYWWCFTFIRLFLYFELMKKWISWNSRCRSSPGGSKSNIKPDIKPSSW